MPPAEPTTMVSATSAVPAGLVDRVRTGWAELAGKPVSFGADVVVSPKSLLCPPGWAGIVVIGDAAVVTAPDDFSAGLIRAALSPLPVEDWADPAVLRTRLPLQEVLGPATLAYCTEITARDRAQVERGADLADLVATVSDEEAGEAGLDEITSEAFVVRSGGRVVAASGYSRWPGDVAHLSVLTSPDHRGRGLAQATAAAATADALANGLLPQWRARPAASRRVARAIGFTELGTQLSVRL
jgi:RimJ/RimL family protein N-acetyltransferase